MLRQFTDKCIAGITANDKRCNFYVQATVSLATALNPYIGYAKAAEIAKEAVATGRSIIEIAREKKLLSEKEIQEILDPARMTEPVGPWTPQKSEKKSRKEIAPRSVILSGDGSFAKRMIHRSRRTSSSRRGSSCRILRNVGASSLALVLQNNSPCRRGDNRGRFR